MYVIIFEADTPAGKSFDVCLLIAVLVSVLVVRRETVESVEAEHRTALLLAEWSFTVLFSAEYIMRLISAPRAGKYALSFFGLVDLASILPAFVGLMFPGAQSLRVVRAFRLIRVFRVFKLVRFLGEERALRAALQASLYKITVFLGAVRSVALTMGAVMYFIEGEASGYTSLPKGMYWAVVTITTVGYGDIAPETPAGQFVAGVLMLIGYGVLAVPTGIVTAEMTRQSLLPPPRRRCSACGLGRHDADAKFCKACGRSMISQSA